MSREAQGDEYEHRPTSGIAVIEDTLAETRGLAEELAEMARLKCVDWEKQREAIKVIADSIESRLEDAEFHLTRQLPDYQPIPSISTRDNPIVDRQVVV
ncbi:MAG: hypothetical protein AAGG48_18120 [Planctomycetota bacterium]